MPKFHYPDPCRWPVHRLVRGVPRESEILFERFHRSCDTEGWFTQYAKMYVAGGQVLLKIEFAGRDCDGLISGQQVFKGRLRTDRRGDLHLIEWVRVESERRDHQAEAAGY